MSEKEELTWFEPFSEKEASSNEGSGLLSRFLKRPQRSTVQIDEQKRSVKFQNSTVEKGATLSRVSTTEAKSTVGENTVVYSTPSTLSSVIDRLDTLGRSKVLVLCLYIT